eukprot:gene12266-biopygen16261
MNSCHEE